MKDGVETFFVVTANRLRDGSTVYLRREQSGFGWMTDIHHAFVFPEGDKEATLEAAKDGEEQNIVVGIYPVEIADKTRPISAREKIRAQGGPTIAYGTDAVGGPLPDYSI